MHSCASNYHTLYDTRHDTWIYWSCLSGSSPAAIRQLRGPAARGNGDLRERIPLLTSSSADGRVARSLSSLSYTSAIPWQRRYDIPQAYSSPTLPSFQQEHHQVVLRISHLPPPQCPLDSPFKIPLSCNSSAELLPLYNISNFALSVGLLGSRS